MSVSTVLQSDTVLSLAAALVGTVWAVVKSSDWFARIQSRRYGRAVEALEDGVEYAFQTYVDAVKGASADGKLTADEARRARTTARDAAIAFGRSRGVDVVRELGHEYLDLWIERIVAQTKND